ncbi:low molecular weight phosphatase family protein [Barrientosiimonas humi]|uniref:arsenate reductase/protein-tyrosine-phosphatase family protein n=1 Tax=Barrientosiimonas humi TaxID=999931 RepID=UPI00370D5B1F
MTRRGTVLVVCTGNVCRSPYIERRLAAELGETVDVTSAGTRALVGSPIEPGSGKLLGELGISADDFEARQLTADMVSQADVVLTATRQHRGAVVKLAPQGLLRTFALADFADLVDLLPGGTARPGFLDEPDDSTVTRVVRAALRQRGKTQPRTDEQAEVVDPIGQSAAVFAEMGRQIEQVLPPVVRALRG